MAKKMYVCPECNAQVRDLKGHTARMHSKSESETKTTAKTLELDVKTKKKEATQAQGYHCVDCGAAISKNQNPCPNCGTSLDWSQV